MYKSIFTLALVFFGCATQSFAKNEAVRVLVYDAAKSSTYDYQSQQQTVRLVREAWENGFIPAIEITPAATTTTGYRLRNGTALSGSNCVLAQRIQLQTSEWGHKPMEMMAKEFWQTLLTIDALAKVEVVLTAINGTYNLGVDFSYGTGTQNAFLQKISSVYAVTADNGIRSCR